MRESGADVLVEGGAYFRQSCGERARDLARGSRICLGRIARILLLERQRQFNLMLERRQSFFKRAGHERIRVSRCQSRRPEVAGVERRHKPLHDLADRLARRQARRRAALATHLGGGGNWRSSATMPAYSESAPGFST